MVEEEKFEKWRKGIGLYLGPLAMVLTMLKPMPSLSPAAHYLFAIIILVVIYWVSEALPLAVTSLLIPVLCILFGVCNEKEAVINFAHPIIFLFLGSFILAKAMELTSIDKIIAIRILSIKWVRKSALRFTFVFSFIIFFLSWWLSNTATTAMMFPIAISLIKRLEEITKVEIKKFGLGLMLLTAYASSIGGVATPVGTPPNLIGIGMLESMAATKVSFFQWMLMIVPLSIIIFLCVYMYIYLTNIKEIKRYWSKELFIEFPKSELSLGKQQWIVIIAFGVTVFLWVFPGLVMVIKGGESEIYKWFSKYISESNAALIGVVLLFFFITMTNDKKSVITWRKVININWEAILLFGGGLTLGTLMFQTGLSTAVANFILDKMKEPALWKLTMIFSLLTGIVTELTSNTATANMAVPLAISLSQQAKVSIMLPALAATIGCSFAYMLPVSTPPNAIVYGSGLISIKDMVKIGCICLVGSAIILFFYMMLIGYFFII
jgi:sodium-dependent dicarboxylate transporter 2/3/5